MPHEMPPFGGTDAAQEARGSCRVGCRSQLREPRPGVHSSFCHLLQAQEPVSHKMVRLTSLFAVLAAAVVSTTAQAQNVRSLAAMPAFQWVIDPHAADPCTEPGCVNHIKYGYNVMPLNVTTDKSIVFQEATRPKGMGAVMYLDIYTQPGCVVSGCTTKKVLGIFPKEDCFNAFAEKVPNQPDNTTALLKFGGNYYENVPAGELYAKFEKKNYLTEKPTCTFEVRGGFKRWY